MRKLSNIVAATCLTFVVSSSLACDKPPSPELPNPDTAVTPQMVKAKNDVKAFLAAAESYLKCNISSRAHNDMVEEMHDLADQFNVIVRAYKKRLAG